MIICFKKELPICCLASEASNDMLRVTVSQAGTTRASSIIAKVNFIKCFNFFPQIKATI